MLKEVFKKTVIILPLCMFIFSTGTAASEKMTHIDEMSVSADNVRKVRMRGIDFAELTYRGEENTREFDITVTYTARVDDREELQEIISELDFEITESNNTLTMSMNNLKERNNSLLNKLFDDTEHRVIFEVIGPISVDIEIESEFSEVMTQHTAGDLTLNTEFTTVQTFDHNGRLNANIEFGNLTTEELVGSFDFNLEFSQGDVAVEYLGDDSHASVEFGNINIDLPSNAGAEFRVSKSLGGVDFDISRSMEIQGGSNRRLIFNNGEHVVELSAEFGKITVSDSMKSSGSRRVRSSNLRRERVEEIEPEPEPEPVFEEGIVRSIRIRGTRLYDRSDIEKKLNITTGKQYTRDEISEEVEKLSENNRLINSAHYTIDIEGNLSVRIYEIEPYDNDFDIEGSFSRIGGLGIGPKLTVSSAIGPLSEFGGGGQYHFANKEWTYHAHAEKHLFDDFRFTFGGTYRREYESSMDWAIPPHDSYVNAFLLGLETNNFYQVEGSTAFISQRLTDMVELKAEYFEEDFSSLKKHTNWSVFNHSQVKEDNPPLNAASLGKITGLRYSLTFSNVASFMNSTIHLEMEKTSDTISRTLPPYTRYFGNLVYNTRFAFDNVIKIRVAGGYSEDILPEQKSFRLGGVNTLRGYEFGMVPNPPAGADGFDYQGGGSKMFLANIDYIIGHRYDDIQLILFGDVGNVWQKGQKVDTDDLKRNVGVGLAFGGDFFRSGRINDDIFPDAFRINWAVPVGNVPHTSMWTVNFVRAY